ncbi:cell division protein FtsQ [Spiribacter vilamensis]|uniref:Cell division protein FtsQ n=2 Tax=Spiribacter vilamensis TaxID=531306 RepID=A0A4Q8CYG0_9GAMM|nr:cell division protein FtsQ [Spiribacter vilamensis]
MLLVGVAMLIAVAGAAWYALDRGLVRPLLPLERVGFDGELAQLQETDLRKVLTGHLTGGLLSVDVGAIRGAVESLPWVATATVRRVWPDALRITVAAHEPVAIWGRGALITADAEVFRPSPLPDLALPDLAGPPGSAARVLERYQGVMTLLEAAPLELESLSLNERRAWTLTLAGGGRLHLGRTSVNARLARFIAAWAEIPEADTRELGVADLRYPDGFALRWQDED